MKKIKSGHYEWTYKGILFTLKKNKSYDVWEVTSGDYENYHEDKYWLTADIMMKIDFIEGNYNLQMKNKKSY